ncbi:MAG TPA: TolC family protein [Bryobacteraceae bacterium]|nr:TolC family protein [Bryobacteraceae bacterium]HPU74485.1 TolC family protein [Bryobacteraceae bacterium]
MWRILAVYVVALPLAAQNPLTLQDAVRLALERHPSVEAGRSAVMAAEVKVAGARSGYLPRIGYSETWLRSNNPVVVFSSLLTQRQFTPANFEINSLNRPAALNNFQSQVVLDQPIYDAGLTRLGVKSANLERSMALEDERRIRMELIAGVVRAYYGAVLARESLNVADEAVRSAEADLNRAQALRAAGMSTQADVLSIQVHLAAMKEQQIRRRADFEVALAALNETLGLPLSEQHELATVLTRASIDEESLEAYEQGSLQARPEARQARFAVGLAETESAAARAALLPQVFAHAGFEVDRQRFLNRGGANWLASISFRWNMFNGGADKARIDAASFGLQRARALENQAEAQIRLQVRRAYADFRSANQRIEVAEAAVSMAEESLRITKNRYEAGLSNVTDLLRNETALLESKTRLLAAVYDQRLAAVNLALAAGNLTPTSEVLN